VFALREGAAWEQTDVDIGSRTHSTWRAPRAELHRAENAGCAETAPRSPECAAPVAASLIPQEFITSARPLARSSPSRAQRCSPLRN
jgi:hypothetical protein